MRLSRAIPAGLVDSGFASLATFVLNLYAIARWESSDAATLGTYFLYMTAFLMASAVPNQLLFVPAEKATLQVAQAARVRLFWRISQIGFPTAVASAVLLLAATFVGLSKGISFAEQIPFLTTAAVATIFSPWQNHARRLLHLAGRSWAAAAVSFVQAAGAAAALLAFIGLGTEDVWIPIGSLAIANIVSISFAAILTYRAGKLLDSTQTVGLAEAEAGMTYKELTPAGRWLVATGVISLGNNFVVESAVFALASPEALALAGAAKTIAQPILVLANGLRSVLGPPSMEAAKAQNQKAARRVRRTFWWLSAAAVVGYTGIAGFEWIGNPLARLIETPYSVPLLVFISIAANGFNGAAFPGRLELIGAGREKQLFRAEIGANMAQLALAVAIAGVATSDAAGSFARPIGFAALGLGRIAGYRTPLATHYASAPPPSSDPGTIPPPAELPPSTM